MDDSSRIPLGRKADYVSRYDAALLFPIARRATRAALGIGDDLPFRGLDVWNAYELSWLDARGKPRVGIGEFCVPSASPNLIESKSLKLYLGSFNQERLASRQAFAERVRGDLSTVAGAVVDVRIGDVDDAMFAPVEALRGECIDELDVSIDDYGPPNAEHLVPAAGAVVVEERLVSHLLKSNCPVTGQPDWASVCIAYAGPRIDRAGLLRYLVSFRQHAGFHEQCVERMFIDLLRRCRPASLSVQARYTRRGGLDINPFRSTTSNAVANLRSVRQ